MFEIPLDNSPNQQFKTTLPINGGNRSLIFNLKYNGEAGYWALSLTDDLTGEMLIDSVPLITGEYPGANILEQWDYLKLGVAAVVKVNPDAESNEPNADNLGTDFVLVWGDNLE